jgi:hypothetical protein
MHGTTNHKYTMIVSRFTLFIKYIIEVRPVIDKYKGIKQCSK